MTKGTEIGILRSDYDPRAWPLSHRITAIALVSSLPSSLVGILIVRQSSPKMATVLRAWHQWVKDLM